MIFAILLFGSARGTSGVGDREFEIVTSERNWVTNVDLPEPEGAEMMNRIPAKVFT